MAGWLGALTGVVSTVLPTALAIILLMNSYNRFKDAQWMKGMMVAVRPVVVIMIAQAAYRMVPTSITGIRTIICNIGSDRFRGVKTSSSFTNINGPKVMGEYSLNNII